MTSTVSTADGSVIAYDREGSGEPLILIGGAGQFRAVDAATRELTTLLAGRGFDVVHYDRPGRGDSTAPQPVTLAREVDAVRTLLELVGGRATLYGSSSGAAIALAAAAELSGVDKLVLWEIPLGDEEGDDAATFLADIDERIAAGDPEGTWRLYMSGLPPEWFDSMRNGPGWPAYERMAPALRGDAEALAWTQSAPHRQLWGSITARTTVLVGESAFPFMSTAADAVVSALPDATRESVPGSDHGWSATDMADTLEGLAS